MIKENRLRKVLRLIAYGYISVLNELIPKNPYSELNIFSPRFSLLSTLEAMTLFPIANPGVRHVERYSEDWGWKVGDGG